VTTRKGNQSGQRQSKKNRVGNYTLDFASKLQIEAEAPRMGGGGGSAEGVLKAMTLGRKSSDDSFTLVGEKDNV